MQQYHTVTTEITTVSTVNSCDDRKMGKKITDSNSHIKTTTKTHLNLGIALGALLCILFQVVQGKVFVHQHFHVLLAKSSFQFPFGIIVSTYIQI